MLFLIPKSRAAEKLGTFIVEVRIAKEDKRTHTYAFQCIRITLDVISLLCTMPVLMTVMLYGCTCG